MNGVQTDDYLSPPFTALEINGVHADYFPSPWHIDVGTNPAHIDDFLPNPPTACCRRDE